MSNFLEQYGKAIFVLILIAILVAFASPLGKMIKDATTKQVSQTEEIGNDEVYVATTGRSKSPKEVNDYVYALLYDDGELVISGTEINPDKNRAIFTCSQGSGDFGKVIIYKNNRPSLPSWTDSMNGRSLFAKHVTSVNIVDRIQPRSCYAWFKDFEHLTEIKNIENLYTDQCVSMESMFYSCYSLTNIDLHYFNTNKVTTMFRMFDSCKSLTSLNLSEFDTSQVRDMYSMFSNCRSLTSLDLSSFDTSQVINMNTMFNNCINLISLDVSGWDTSNVGNMSSMFYGCNKLQSITASQTVKERLLNSTSVPADVTWIIK